MRRLPVICGVLAVAAAAAAVPLIAVACSSAPAARPAAGGSHSPQPSPSEKPSPAFKPYPHVNKPCKGKIPEPFAGIATNGQFAANVASFRRSTGAHLRVVEVYNPFPGPFQSAQAQQIESVHALPLIQLNPRRISMALLASGAYDSDIRSYARQVRAFGCHVVLSFGHEMNGWWYPWGLPYTTPKVFKAAYRHFHNVFAAEGARNVLWSWDPTHQYAQFRPGKVAYPASMWYPGNRYVDWIGIDGYVGAGQDFNAVFRYQLRDIRRLTSKPIYLAETGVGDSAREVRQIANLFAGIWHWHLAGLVWFDLNRKNSWSLDGKPTKDAAFRRAIARFP
jgi:mannan endo-1,4-beta-mannosidase